MDMQRQYELAEDLAERGHRLGFGTLSMAEHVVVQVALGLQVIDWESDFFDFFLCAPNADADAVAASLEIIGHPKAALIFRHAKKMNAMRDYPELEVLTAALLGMIPAIRNCLVAYELKNGIRIPKHQTKTMKYSPLTSAEIMKKAILDEINQGYLTPQKMEKLVMNVLGSVGAINIKQTPTSKDNGVDIIATFLVGRVAQIGVGVLVRCHAGVTENHCLDHCLDTFISGLETENLLQGWFVTTGTFDKNAQEYMEKKLQGTGPQIFLVDGNQLAELIIGSGLENIV